jgi:hypothetical protein
MIVTSLGGETGEARQGTKNLGDGSIGKLVKAYGTKS